MPAIVAFFISASAALAFLGPASSQAQTAVQCGFSGISPPCVGTVIRPIETFGFGFAAGSIGGAVGPGGVSLFAEAVTWPPTPNPLVDAEVSIAGQVVYRFVTSGGGSGLVDGNLNLLLSGEMDQVTNPSGYTQTGVILSVSGQPAFSLLDGRIDSMIGPNLNSLFSSGLLSSFSQPLSGQNVISVPISLNGEGMTSILIRLLVDVEAAGGASVATSDFSAGLRLADGPVITGLPPGVRIDTAGGVVVDNLYTATPPVAVPEASFLQIMQAALVTFGYLGRKRRQADREALGLS